jgi:hypothetical protein
MELGELVKNVMGDLMRGMPEHMPSTISVDGGNGEARYAISQELHKRTGAEILEECPGVYSISLDFFIKKYDPSFC